MSGHFSYQPSFFSPNYEATPKFSMATSSFTNQVNFVDRKPHSPEKIRNIIRSHAIEDKTNRQRLLAKADEILGKSSFRSQEKIQISTSNSQPSLTKVMSPQHCEILQRVDRALGISSPSNFDYNLQNKFHNIPNLVLPQQNGYTIEPPTFHSKETLRNSPYKSTTDHFKIAPLPTLEDSSFHISHIPSERYLSARNENKLPDFSNISPLATQNRMIEKAEKETKDLILRRSQISEQSQEVLAKSQGELRLSHLLRMQADDIEGSKMMKSSFDKKSNLKKSSQNISFSSDRLDNNSPQIQSDSPPREQRKSHKQVTFSPSREEPLASPNKSLSESKLLHVKELYCDGASFIGDKLGNSKNGAGEMLYPNGSKYSGEWRGDKRSGYGILTLSTGEEEYNGDWENDVYHGTGILVNTLVLPSQKPLEIKEGFGDFEVSWTRYEGSFAEGRKHGFGTLIFLNQDKYVGNFVNDQMCGTGTLYKYCGDIIFGDWKCNKLTQDA